MKAIGDLIARLRRDRFDLSATAPASPTELDRLEGHFVLLLGRVAPAASADFAVAARALAENVASLNSISYRLGWNHRGENLARELEQERTEAGLRELAEVAAEDEGAGL